MRILRGLRSKLLPCGCTAGVYETYDGHIVALLDEREPGCPDTTHEAGIQLRDSSIVGDPSQPALRNRRS